MTHMYEAHQGKSGRTWNPLGGECQHKCKYCYEEAFKRRFPAHREKYTGNPRLLPSEMRGNPGTQEGCNVFVCSANDLFASHVPAKIIIHVLAHCKQYPQNTYLFQTKNPGVFSIYSGLFPKKTILATTLETNRDIYDVSEAPSPRIRAAAMVELGKANLPLRRMVTIEPILNFDVVQFMDMLKAVDPDIIYIGADTQRNNLDEPNKIDVWELIVQIRSKMPDTELHIKPGLWRLFEGVE